MENTPALSIPQASFFDAAAAAAVAVAAGGGVQLGVWPGTRINLHRHPFRTTLSPRRLSHCAHHLPLSVSIGTSFFGTSFEQRSLYSRQRRGRVQCPLPRPIRRHPRRQNRLRGRRRRRAHDAAARRTHRHHFQLEPPPLRYDCKAARDGFRPFRRGWRG